VPPGFAFCSSVSMCHHFFVYFYCYPRPLVISTVRRRSSSDGESGRVRPGSSLGGKTGDEASYNCAVK